MPNGVGPTPAGPTASGPNTAGLAAQTTKTGTQNASGGLQQQQQTVMAQMFSAFLTRFMGIASENSNNG